jgi:hypothetical protein
VGAATNSRAEAPFPPRLIEIQRSEASRPATRFLRVFIRGALAVVVWFSRTRRDSEMSRVLLEFRDRTSESAFQGIGWLKGFSHLQGNFGGRPMRGAQVFRAATSNNWAALTMRNAEDRDCSIGRL